MKYEGAIFRFEGATWVVVHRDSMRVYAVKVSRRAIKGRLNSTKIPAGIVLDKECYLHRNISAAISLSKFRTMYDKDRRIDRKYLPFFKSALIAY